MLKKYKSQITGDTILFSCCLPGPKKRKNHPNIKGPEEITTCSVDILPQSFSSYTQCSVQASTLHAACSAKNVSLWFMRFGSVPKYCYLIQLLITVLSNFCCAGTSYNGLSPSRCLILTYNSTRGSTQVHACTCALRVLWVSFISYTPRLQSPPAANIYMMSKTKLCFICIFFKIQLPESTHCLQNNQTNYWPCFQTLPSHAHCYFLTPF